LPCKDRFDFDSNLYWNRGGENLKFATSEVDNPREAHEHSFKDWQKMGEDVNSLMGTHASQPTHPADDFTCFRVHPLKDWVCSVRSEAGWLDDEVAATSGAAARVSLQVMGPEEY